MSCGEMEGLSMLLSGSPQRVKMNVSVEEEDGCAL